MKAKTIIQQRNAIAKLLAYKDTRFFLLFASALCTFYYFSHRYGLYSIYVFFFSLLAPFFIEHAFPSQEGAVSSELALLMKTHAYTNTKQLSLQITFWACNILLFVLQLKMNQADNITAIAHLLPSLVLIGHILVYFLLYYYYQFKLHYQLLNNDWN